MVEGVRAFALRFLNNAETLVTEFSKTGDAISDVGDAAGGAGFGGSDMTDAADAISSVADEVPVSDLRDSLVKSLDELQAKYKPITDMIDAYRYKARAGGGGRKGREQGGKAAAACSRTRTRTTHVTR